MDAFPKKIDLHIHTTASDGTDTPELLLEKVRAAGIGMFAITDHDAVKNCDAMRALLGEGDPLFLQGVELSCRDPLGRYHILGYAYDLESPDTAIRAVVDKTHANRMRKVRLRLDFIAERFGFTFPQEELDALWALNNPGKPHIGKLMVQHGYAPDVTTAIKEYIDLAKTGPDAYIPPEEAIRAITESGGIPILAHPAYGDGGQLLDVEELDARVRRLMDFGLRGMECYYSGFTPKLQAEALSLAERYGLYVTAGSDYHGKNKLVVLGDNNLDDTALAAPGLRKFLAAVLN